MTSSFHYCAEDQAGPTRQREGCLYPSHILAGILNEIGEWPRNILARRILILGYPRCGVAFAVRYLLSQRLTQQPCSDYVASERKQNQNQRPLGIGATKNAIHGTKDYPVRAYKRVAHLQASFSELSGPILELARYLLQGLFRRGIKALAWWGD